MSFASVFLYVSAGVFLVALALPLFFVPLAWGRRVGWSIPEDTQLTVYFGRSLGAVALAIIAVALRAAPEADKHPLLFELIALIGVLVGLVHVWGLIKKAQPPLEHAEIPVFFALAALAAWIRAGL